MFCRFNLDCYGLQLKILEYFTVLNHHLQDYNLKGFKSVALPVMNAEYIKVEHLN